MRGPTADDVRLAVKRYAKDTRPETRNEMIAVVMAYYNPPPPPPNRCYRCGRVEFEDGAGPLTDVLVQTAWQEEGFSRIEKWVCDEHLAELQDEFQRLGFVSHHHGSTTLLEDRSCPGYEVYGACPTPKGYGEEDLEEP